MVSSFTAKQLNSNDNVLVSSCGKRQWQGIPGIERAANGRLWCTFFSGGSKEPHIDNEILLTTSMDNGKSWREPEVIASAPGHTRAFDPCLWHDPNDKLWLFYNLSNIKQPRHQIMAMTTTDSDKENPVWLEPFEIELSLPFAFRLNKPTVTTQGVWLLPVTWSKEPLPIKEGQEIWLEAENQLQGVAISRDQGASWIFRGALKAPCWALENMIVEKNNGTLWMLIRTGDGWLWESFSEDQGTTWAEAAPSQIANPGSRFHIRRLKSGKLLLINHANFSKSDDNQNGRNNLAMMLSEDDGQTWSEPLILDSRNNVSYPDAIEGPEGIINIVHDRERGTIGEILFCRIHENNKMREISKK